MTAGAVRVTDRRDGWPAAAELHVGGSVVPVSLHVGLIGLSHRGRDDRERRCQNPESMVPVTALPGTLPMIIGTWYELGFPPVLVAYDAARRLGNVDVRVSLFVSLTALQTAARDHWYGYTTSSDENIVAFHPALFPLYAEMFAGGVLLDQHRTASVLESAEAAPNDVASIERARRATSSLVRDARFRRAVVDAYGGQCAMCGVGLGLVEGAHILPVSVPGSSDDPSNGLALCPNHHAAFDRHLLLVEPGTRRVRQSPILVSSAHGCIPSLSFVSSTFEQLCAPLVAAVSPSDEMLERRLAHFADEYDWWAA